VASEAGDTGKDSKRVRGEERVEGQRDAAKRSSRRSDERGTSYNDKGLE